MQSTNVVKNVTFDHFPHREQSNYDAQAQGKIPEEPLTIHVDGDDMS